MRAEENNKVKVSRFLLSVAHSSSVISRVLESAAANNRIVKHMAYRIKKAIYAQS